MAEPRITDLRVAVVGPAPFRCPILRIDTDRPGLYGLGEVRDGASPTYALLLKSRLLGENPLDVERIVRKLKPFGGHGRAGGGVSGIEMALWDIAGKHFGVPVYALLGGRYRDRVRIYADTPESPDPHTAAERLAGRMRQGIGFLKMDLGVNLLAGTKDSLALPTGAIPDEHAWTPHMFTGMELTDRGIARLCEYLATVRNAIGYEAPLALDHFGHIGPNSSIRLGKALERFNPAWLEDLVPWQETLQWRRITEAVHAPTCTGEDIYLKEGFEALLRERAVDIVHPDLATAGGILETKRIGDFAEERGVAMAMHFAGTPVSFFANVHCAAATSNVLALEHHSLDIPWWDDLITGVPKPIVQEGFVRVPDGPGLGIALDDSVVQQHLAEPGYFLPTPQWDRERSWDRLWS